MIFIKKAVFFVLTTCLVCCLIFYFYCPIWANPEVYHGTHYNRGVELLNQGKLDEAIHEFEHAVAQSEQAAYLRKLAEAYEKNQQYQKASETYYREAEKYLEKGLLDAYLVEKAKGDALATDIEMFYQQEGSFACQTKLAKYEPSSGVYIGAFVEYDSNVGPKNVGTFNSLTGKKHAVFYTYHEYGKPFPVNWAAQVKEAGAAVHLSLEPNRGLDIVQNDDYLQQFAQDAGDLGIPVFIRFASEMNGDWVSWNGNPEKYIEKFRLVSDVMQKYAPNVAMIWAPNSVPQKEITKYYPGDNWVDWVGVNLYSVCFYNGDPTKPADKVNPLDLLDFVYKEYAGRKPIMVAEYAATHFSGTGNLDATKFAIAKMNMLYQGVRLLYPRVKAINWYSVNNFTHAHSSERRLNNFSLTENIQVLTAYQNLISDPYFLSTVKNGPNASKETSVKTKIIHLNNAKIDSSVQCLTWVKTYDPYIGSVVYRLDGQLLTECRQYPFSFLLDTKNLTPGRHEISALVFDSQNRKAAEKTTVFYYGVSGTGSGRNRIVMYLNNRTANINGCDIRLSEAPFIKEERTMVPLRFISEIIGAGVDWDSSLKKITITKDKTICLWLNQKNAAVNGTVFHLDTYPKVKNGTTFVPLSFIVKHLGGEVTYDYSSKKIEILFQ